VLQIKCGSLLLNENAKVRALNVLATPTLTTPAPPTTTLAPTPATNATTASNATTTTTTTTAAPANTTTAVPTTTAPLPTPEPLAQFARGGSNIGLGGLYRGATSALEALLPQRSPMLYGIGALAAGQNGEATGDGDGGRGGGTLRVEGWSPSLVCAR
jgi:hypothetical protein